MVSVMVRSSPSNQTGSTVFRTVPVPTAQPNGPLEERAVRAPACAGRWWSVAQRVPVVVVLALAAGDRVVERDTVVSPTLAVFERQPGDKETTDMHVRAFKQMEAFVGRASRAGAHVVVGSHSDVPHAKRGWAYQREMELLVESGLTPMQVIVAGTMENARFFRIADRLGSVETGKLADLVLIEGDPLRNISDIRNVKRVMLNGNWVNGAGAEVK